MKSIYAKVRLFLLVLAFSIVPLIAIEMPMGEIVAPEEEAQKQKLYEQFKDLDMSTFQKNIIPLTSFQRDMLLGMFLADANKARDVRDKILFLVEKIPPRERGGLGEELLWAYKNNDKVMIKKLRALGGDISKVLEGAVFVQPDIILTLLRDGAQPDVTAMQHAFLVSEYVSEPIDPELSKEELEKARKVRQLLPQMLKAMKDIKRYSFDLLSSANDQELVDMLLKAGVDINAQAKKYEIGDFANEQEGDTALIHAVKKLRDLKRGERAPDFLVFITEARIKRLTNLIPYLVTQGADPSIKNKKRESARSLARKAGLADLVKSKQRVQKRRPR